MAKITANGLTAGIDAVDRNSYDTASVSPAANQVIIAAVKQILGAGSLTKPTCTGNGLTWVEIGSAPYDTASTPVMAITIFRAMGGSPSTGVITFDFGGQTQDLVTWTVVEFANVDTTGTNGSGAIVQAVVGTPLDSGTTFVVNLAPSGDYNNAVYGTIADQLTTQFTKGTGFTELYDADVTEGMQTQWRDTPDSTVTWIRGSGLAGGFACELKNATQSGSVNPTVLLNDGSETDLTIYTTASVSPAANNLLLLTVRGKALGTTNNSPTVAGNGVTWVQIEEYTYLTDGSANRVRGTLFRAMGGSPSSGTIVITFGVEQIRSAWTLIEFANVNTGGSNGASAVVQSDFNHQSSGSTNTVTLSAFGDALNATFGTLNIRDGGTPTVGSGFDELTNVGFNSIDLTEFKTTNDTTVDWTGLPARDTAIMAVEIKSVLVASGARAAGTAGHLGVMLGW